MGTGEMSMSMSMSTGMISRVVGLYKAVSVCCKVLRCRF